MVLVLVQLLVTEDVWCSVMADLKTVKVVHIVLPSIVLLPQPLFYSVYILQLLEICLLKEVVDVEVLWPLEVLREALGAHDGSLLHQIQGISVVATFLVDNLVLVELDLLHAVADALQGVDKQGFE